MRYLFLALSVVAIIIAAAIFAPGQNVNYPGLPADVARTDRVNIFKTYQQLTRNVDTSDFRGTSNGTKTQSGQVNKVAVVNALPGSMDLQITNSNITDSSIITVSLEILDPTDDLNKIVITPVFKISAPGVMDIFWIEQAGAFSGNREIHYTIN